MVALSQCSQVLPSTTYGLPTHAPSLEGNLSLHPTSLGGLRVICDWRGEELSPFSLAPRLVEGFSPSRAGELPPSALRSGKGCGSALILFHTVGAGPFTTPGQLFWQNRGKHCSSGNGNDLTIEAGRGI